MRTDWKSKPRRVLRKSMRISLSRPNLQTIALWTAALLAGSVSVVFSLLFARTDLFHQRFLRDHPSLAWVATPILFLLAWWVVRRFSPAAAGSGIPQILATLEANPSRHPGIAGRLLSLRVIVVKIVSALLGLAGGATIGREGPTLQISACVFRGMGNWLGRYFPSIQPNAWITAGAAAGLASAFNTPLGGIVFAIEELKLTAFSRFRTLLLSSIIVAGLVSQGILGGYLYLGNPAMSPFRFEGIPSAILVGIVTGFAGAWFGRILLALMKWRNRWESPWRGAAIALGCGLVAAGLMHLSPASSGSGREVITGLLVRSESAGFGLAGIRFSSTIVSYVSGMAGGIFAPSLSIGACIGSAASALLHSTSANHLILLGMIGFLTGVTRTPFTAFVLVLEMTDRHSAIFTMMLAALSADGVARYVQSQSFYGGMKSFYLAGPGPKVTEGNKAGGDISTVPGV